MSAPTYISCDLSNLSLEEILNAILAKDADGVFGLRSVVDVVPADEISDGLECGQPPFSLEDVLRRSIVLGADNKPAIRFIQAS